MCVCACVCVFTPGGLDGVLMTEMTDPTKSHILITQFNTK